MKIGDKLRGLYKYLRHPIYHTIHNSKDYKDLTSKYETTGSENKTLTSKLDSLLSEKNILIEKIISLEIRVTAQEGQLTDKDNEILRLQEDNAYAHRDKDQAIKDLLSIKLDIQEAYETCRNVKTAEDVIFARGEANKHNNDALTDWVEGPKQVLEKQNNTLKSQCAILEGHAFSGRVNSFINQNEQARRTAMGFYDFENKNFYCNTSAVRLLKISLDDSFLSLRGLLRVVGDNEYKTKDLNTTTRKYILKSLKEGEPIENLEIHIPDKRKKIYLTTRPVEYMARSAHVSCNKSFGILMFFYEPTVWFGKVPKNQEKTEKILGLLKKDFSRIYDDVVKVIPRSNL